MSSLQKLWNEVFSRFSYQNVQLKNCKLTKSEFLKIHFVLLSSQKKLLYIASATFNT